jgi:hypothetical protein
MNYLINRVQRDDEPTESFVWEIISLSKQVFPQEEVADAVRRCRAAFTPKLRCLIPDLLVRTPEALIERCKSANHDMREGENRAGNTSNIPPSHPAFLSRKLSTKQRSKRNLQQQQRSKRNLLQPQGMDGTIEKDTQTFNRILTIVKVKPRPSPPNLNDRGPQTTEVTSEEHQE